MKKNIKSNFYLLVSIISGIIAFGMITYLVILNFKYMDMTKMRFTITFWKEELISIVAWCGFLFSLKRIYY